jgi:ferredoxin
VTLRITDDCIVCGACDYVCPNDAITTDTKLYTIDPVKCTECVGSHDKPQCIEACPVDCILPHLLKP